MKMEHLSEQVMVANIGTQHIVMRVFLFTSTCPLLVFVETVLYCVGS